MKISEIKRIIVSRTDSIGDVMLTLPLCTWIKSQFPNATLVFLARSYTIPVIACFAPIDEILDWDAISNLPTVEKTDRLKADCIIHVFPNAEIANLAKKAKISFRIGTSHRIFHFLTCNYKVNFTRKKSDLHEAQLNFELVRPLGLVDIPSLEDLGNQTSAFKLPINNVYLPIDKSELSRAIILHPKSKGSALEWPIEKYVELGSELVKNGKTVLITGTESEGIVIRNHFAFSSQIIDLTGKLSLPELIALVSMVKVIVACSTGPIHIAAVLGTPTIALFSSRKPIHPGRWRPLGNRAATLVFNPDCPDCKKGKVCRCLEKIPTSLVASQIYALK